MDLTQPSAMIWTAVAIQTMGIACLVLARVSERSRHQALCHWLFLICLLLVGLTTMLSLRSGWVFGVQSGFTLGLMIVGSTCDFGTRRAATNA
jgi:hypothetical protein